MTDVDTGFAAPVLRAGRPNSGERTPGPAYRQQSVSADRPRPAYPPAPRTPVDPRHGRASGAIGLWASLPRELAIRFKPRVDPLARAILQEVQRAVPESAKRNIDLWTG